MIQSVTQTESIGSRHAVHQCQHRRISAESLRIVCKDVIAVHAVAHNRHAITHGDARLQVPAGVHQKWRIAGDRRATHIDRSSDKPEYPRPCQRSVDGWRPKACDAYVRGRDGLRLIDLVILKAPEEKRFVLDDRTANGKAIFVKLQLRALFPLVIAEPLVRVIVRVAVEVESRAVNCIRAEPRCHDNVCSAVAALFRRGA